MEDDLPLGIELEVEIEFVRRRWLDGTGSERPQTRWPLQRECQHPRAPDVVVVVDVESDIDAVAVGEVSDEGRRLDLDLRVDAGLVLLRAESRRTRVDVDLRQQ